jgi:hypothetical protein
MRIPMIALVAIVAGLSIALHRRGVTWGDDYTLYLRQARSLMEGNIGQVIADNRFNVDNAAKPSFSPYVYPWGWPLLLAPFVRLWGEDYERLKLLGVACWCGFLVLFEQILRPRLGRVVAFCVVASLGLTLAYLRYTNSILSELPYMLAVAATLWWLDRCRRNGPLDHASRHQLVVLGLLAMVAFNVRREGVALLAAIVATQLVDLRGRWRGAEWRHIATPVTTFVVSAVLCQLLLPSALMPEYVDAGLHQTWRKLSRSFRDSFETQLGFSGMSGWLVVLVLLTVFAGMIVRLRHHLADDIALAVFGVLSLALVGMIPAVAARYTLAVTPIAVYFAAQAILALAHRLRLRGPARFGASPAQLLVCGVFLALATVHAGQLADPIAATRRFNDDGQVEDGPLRPYAIQAFDAVRQHTRAGDVVAFFKARSMTFFTDRRAIQSSDLDIVLQRADYFLMRRNSTFSQPLVSDSEAADLRLTNVWSSDEWVLWRIPRTDS